MGVFIVEHDFLSQNDSIMKHYIAYSIEVFWIDSQLVNKCSMPAYPLPHFGNNLEQCVESKLVFKLLLSNSDLDMLGM